MGTALTSLIALFLVIGATITAVYGVLDSGGDRSTSLVAGNELLVAELETSIDLLSATAYASDREEHSCDCFIDDGLS